MGCNKKERVANHRGICHKERDLFGLRPSGAFWARGKCSAGTARSNIAVEFYWVVEGGGKWSKHEWLNGHFGSSVCL